MKYIYVHNCFDVCSWVQTHLVWECAWMRVRACLRQQFRAAQSMLGSLSLQIRQEEITQVYRGSTIPHVLCQSPFLHYSLDLLFSLPHSFMKPHLCSSSYSFMKIIKTILLECLFSACHNYFMPILYNKKRINQLDMNLSAQCIAGAIILLK